MDELDKKILNILQRNGRIKWSQLAKELGKPRTTITERVYSLEKRKIIRGYSVNVDPSSLGYKFTAYILMRVKREKPVNGLSNQIVLTEKIVKDSLTKGYMPWIEDAQIITGPFDVLLKVRVKDWETLTNFLIVYLPQYESVEHTETMLVLYNVANGTPAAIK